MVRTSEKLNDDRPQIVHDLDLTAGGQLSGNDGSCGRIGAFDAADVQR